MKTIQRQLKGIINKLPYIRKIVKDLNDYKDNSYTPPGHFYSPVISLEEVQRRERSIFAEPDRTIDGIDLNEEYQRNLLSEFRNYYSQLSFPDHEDSARRFYYDNRYFTHADAIFLYLVLRHFRPKKIIEVGSGFSSAAMLDINEIHFSNQIELTFIEPYPGNRFQKLERPGDRYQLVESFVQDVEKEMFRQLQAGDILFVDSSHVVKTGSDVHYLIFEILPLLRQGVIIHFHDIFYPFEYPKDWLMEKRSWNESYFLRAFLHNNAGYRIILFNSFLQRYYSDILSAHMPLILKDRGSSLWIVKS